MIKHCTCDQCVQWKHISVMLFNQLCCLSEELQLVRPTAWISSEASSGQPLHGKINVDTESESMRESG